jgi:uncharacterized protein
VDRLDPRDPLVVDTRELGRRAGSMKRLSRTVPAPGLPDRFGNDVLQVPEGEDIALDLRLEAVMEGVLVSGEATARVSGECVRCLDPVEQRLDADFQELYVYPDVEVPGEDPDDVLRLSGDLLDLRQVLRDAVVLALPLLPLCQQDCPGLCSECGARLADDPEHQHAAADPRWAALHSMFDSASSADPQEK